jgi:hypothetical protein
MEEKAGTIKIVPIGPGEAHIQNEILERKCFICHKEFTDDMVLMRIKDKQMSFVCLDHDGTMQEFLRQFKTIPFGWVKTSVKELRCVGAVDGATTLKS